jgi:hypothetical protein
MWTVERNREQGVLVAAMYQRAAAVPCERESVMAAGLPGADTSAVLGEAGVDRSQFLVIRLDDIKEEMAARRMIPPVSGLSAMEASELVHAESAWLAKRLGLRAVADGRNILWDITMASATVAESWLEFLQAEGYRVRGVFADISVEESVRRSEAEYRRKHEEYRNGKGYGGRYIRPEAIRALADGGGGVSGPAPTGVSGPAPAPRNDRSGAAASDDVTGPILGYVAGNLTLEDVVTWFRARHWPEVPGACPPGLERAAPAIDDPEPYVPGSFDDVVRAYDLGQLNDLDYDFLGGAVVASRRAEK